jgi:branched-chain amino acid transport system permease protein
MPARFILVMLTLPLLLAGCAQLVDSDAARVCRSLLPVLDREAATVTIMRSTLTGRTSSVEQAIAIDYTIPGSNRTPRRIACLFKPQSPGDKPDAQLGMAALLTAVVSDEGTLGPMRLHLLKQNWIARGGAWSADPAPYATIGTIPDAPRWLVATVQHGLSALPVISIYALLAAAYALVYGLVGRINLAFGELTVLAGYGAFLGFTIFGGQDLLLGALAGAIVLALYTGASQGLALGRWVLEPLAGRPGQHVLIATSGLSLFWFELMRLSQGSSTRWIGPVFNRPLALMRDGSYVVTVTPMALILPLVAGTCAIALLCLMQRTRFGRRWRAFSDDPKAAEMLGTDPRKLIQTTMLAASACAAVAGLLTTLYYGGVGFAGGQMTGLKALIAAIIGGIGTVPGALLGGVVLGLAETAWSAVFAIETRDPAIFVLLCLLLALRPDGVLGRSDGLLGRKDSLLGRKDR